MSPRANIDLKNPRPAMIAAARACLDLPASATLAKRQRHLTRLWLAVSAVEAHEAALETLNDLLRAHRFPRVDVPPRPLIQGVVDSWWTQEERDANHYDDIPLPRRIVAYTVKPSAIVNAAFDLGLQNAWKVVAAEAGYTERTGAVLRLYWRRRQKESRCPRAS